MAQIAGGAIAELPGVARRPGRPASGKALTPAERKRAQRARLALEGVGEIAVRLPVALIERLEEFRQFKDTTKDEVVERALVAFFRKR